MGCSFSNPCEEVIQSFNLTNEEIRRKEETRQHNLDPVGEESLKHVSYIPFLSDSKPRLSEDPSMFKMLQDI